MGYPYWMPPMEYGMPPPMMPPMMMGHMPMMSVNKDGENIDNQIQPGMIPVPGMFMPPMPPMPPMMMGQGMLMGQGRDPHIPGSALPPHPGHYYPPYPYMPMEWRPRDTGESADMANEGFGAEEQSPNSECDEVSDDNKARADQELKDLTEGLKTLNV